MAAPGDENGEGIEEVKFPAFMKIKVKSQDGKETFFKINRDTPMKKLLQSYCRKFRLSYQATQFYLEGQRFIHAKTPIELGLEENEVEIEAMADQLGGGGGE
ncbi:OLC1v1019162C1 [Oldenlandia corymbosa var. corymbosa]|uniref:OLC1v1019162C1 n=1 Tax=Oldenlandia corymbosa var. corymbosa TaxID=529605 RepID=A0AAV1EDS4_OLDCO|nr:OLC1v1019162C1 [Oldenlandia corymbosa var. corymbosa]